MAESNMNNLSQGARAIRAAVERLSDAQWLDLLKWSVTDGAVCGLPLPGFPSHDLQVSTVGSHGQTTLDEAFAFYSYVKEACVSYNRPLKPTSQILDFGIGWGRIARFFLKDVDIDGLYGVDTDPTLVEVCRKTGVPANVRSISPRGTLPFDTNSFHLVFAYSVFTHLPLDVHLHWLDEIRRVLAPGGLFIATVEPPRFLQYFANMGNGDARNSWEEFLSTTIKSRPDLQASLDATGYAYIDYATHADYGDCVVARSFIDSQWSRFFEIVSYLDDPARFFQAVVTARKGLPRRN